MPVVADLVHVLCAEAGLDVAQPPARGVLGAEQVVQQRLHAAAGEQRGRVFAQHERGARDDHVTMLDQHVQVGPAYLARVHVTSVASRATEIPATLAERKLRSTSSAQARV
jgi:hypothetical protein